MSGAIGPATTRVRERVLSDTALGSPFTVRTLRLGGLLDVIDAFQKSGVQPPPPLLQIDWLEHITDPAERVKALEANVRDRFGVFTRWIVVQRQLLPAVIRSVTSLSDEQVLQLDITDIVQVLVTALELTDLKLTLELAVGFFTQAGGLMEMFAAKKRDLADPEPVPSSATETTGPSS